MADQELAVSSTNSNPENSTQPVKAQAFRVLLDSSVFFALVYEEDGHHRAAKTALTSVKSYGVEIYLPTLVILEVMSNLIRKGIRASQAEKIVSNTIRAFDMWNGGKFEVKKVLEMYKAYSKAIVAKLKPNDFYVVVESIGIGAALLTCDYEMYSAGKRKTSVYFLGEDCSKCESDLPKLLKECIRRVRKTSS